ncbi:uncharacterized protein RB166_003789 [Leptodactylus fuscus]
MADREELKQKANICDICNVSCSSAFQLCEHVVGHKHKTNVKRVSPGCLPHLNKLQYFFDTYMKMEPLLGLEYVEEMQMVSGFQYRCRLCSFHGERKPAFLHITGPEHMAKYLDKHHPRLSVPPNRHPQRSDYIKALQHATGKVCEMYGREKITENSSEDNKDGPSPQKMAKYSSSHKTATDINGDFHTRSQRYLERRGDERLGFKGNSDFLDYLQKFEIQNDEDARIIKLITHNCTQALVRFREEQAHLYQPSGEVPGGSSTSASRTDKGSTSGANSGQAAPSTAPVSQTDATRIFFSSIKNMEESEVVGILHKIAATNAAFRGIDIPSVMKYLQATGRLKTS